MQMLPKSKVLRDYMLRNWSCSIDEILLSPDLILVYAKIVFVFVWNWALKFQWWFYRTCSNLYKKKVLLKDNYEHGADFMY